MRADGIRLKKIDPMYTVVPYIMNKRTDSMNMVTIDIPVEPIKKYRNEKRAAGTPVSNLAVIIAAYIRTVAKYPQLNRFIANCVPYARKDFSVAMVVLRSNDRENGTMSKVWFDLNDTVFDVEKKISDYIEINKQSVDTNNTDKMIKALLSIPGLCRVGVGLFKLMEKMNLLPKAVINLSPFHNSVVISDLISIKTNHIYHHIYEFGTTSVFISMGNMREVPVRHGKDVEFVKCLPMGIVMDERICSGSYFALAFQEFGNLLKNPALLENKPEKICYDEALLPKQLKKITPDRV